MSYYSVLGLEKEPFSSSPDPAFFYHSLSHHSILKRLEIAIRLRRGLCVVLGDVGTGKTTLSRALVQAFKDDDDVIFHMILDPSFKSEFQFLQYLVKMFKITPAINSTIDFKEALQKYLLQKGVEENKTVVLLIDEAQTISNENLEVLRTLLNFETNEFKLLQLVIMGQSELLERIKKIKNFMDRIALKYMINPLDENETAELIRFRLKQAGYKGQDDLFTPEAVQCVYEFTQGYPRKIAMVCHDAVETAIMYDRLTITGDMVRDLCLQKQL